MILKDITFPTPQENILFDDVLFYIAERISGSEVLRFWESKQLFIVLGRISKVEEDIKVEQTYKDNIPVMRRFSGGGTVLQGRGCLNYTLVLSKDRDPRLHDLRQSYQWILNKVISGLKKISIKAEFRPVSDVVLASQQKKISGNAQKRGRSFILHHGTILYDFDLSNMECYLKIPKTMPEYRSGRSHLDFVTNIPATPVQIKSVIKEAFNVMKTENDLNKDQQEWLHAFMKTKEVAVDLTQLFIFRDSK